MYTLYIDKPELFEAHIQIEGASISNTICRLVLEHNNHSLLFEGKIEKNTAKIPLNSLKSILKEGDTGLMKLEVIADDTYFVPWKSDYLANVSKKITAEVKEPTAAKIESPKVKITNINVKTDSNMKSKFISELSSRFIKEKISIVSVKKDINRIKSITKSVNSKFNINQNELLECVTTALKSISI